MTLSKTLIPALILLSGSGGAMAAEESIETMPSFSQVDADQNGGISTTEAQAVHGLVEVFAQADFNTDGWLNQGEYTAIQQASEGETS